MSYRLVVTDNDRVQRFLLVEGDNLVGSGAVCVILIAHPTVSRRHASVRVVGDRVAIEDLGSRNGTFTSQGYNMIGTTEGCTVAGDTTGNVTNFNLSLADLGVLADNGGPTLTHSIGPTSLAVDGGDPAGCVWDDDGDNGTPPVTLSTDQRGYVRVDSRCDIGAFERDGFAPDPIFRDAFESGDTWGWSDVSAGS